MIGIKLPRVKPGDKIKAVGWNQLCDAVERMRLTVTAPLQLSSTPRGTALSLAIPPAERFAKTDGSGLTARSSLTLGTGTCRLYDYDGVSTLSDSSVDATVRNWSSTAVPANSFCIVRLFMGQWVVVAVEC